MNKHNSSIPKWTDWLSAHQFFKPLERPLEIYLFIDPTCSICFELDSIIKRLKLEYGHYFTLKHVFSKRPVRIQTKHKAQNHYYHSSLSATSRAGISCDENIWIRNPESSLYITPIAIKAAEFQGKKAGYRFFKKIQEALFLDQECVSNRQTLLSCARKADIDCEEFLRDIQSESAIKAFQCDLKISSEMDITDLPSLVFFNQKMEDGGIKVSGTYPYEVFVQILEEMLGFPPKVQSLPSLEDCIKDFQIINTEEIAFIYQMEKQEVEREMKKLLLKRTVEKVSSSNTTYWRFAENQGS